MSFKFCHSAISVSNLEKSIDFYERALGLSPVRTIKGANGDYKIVFLGNEKSAHTLELKWEKAPARPIAADEGAHFGFCSGDAFESFKKHSEMGCTTTAQNERGFYFIEDPDGHKIEILPEI